jgi:CBS domain-containing protein/ribosome-associated translation inhibitor RaiA
MSKKAKVVPTGTKLSHIRKSSLPQLREIMRPNVVTIEPKVAASVAWDEMQRRGIRHLVVAENGRLNGVISERDLGGRTRPDIRKGRLVQDLMAERVVSADANMTLRRAANLMLNEVIGCLPVLDNGQLVGVVTASEVLDELSADSIRKPLVGWLPRKLKQPGRRKGSTLIPAHIRVSGTTLSPGKRMYIRKKLGAKFGKFAESIARISVRVKDVNGPRGGIDQVCQIKVVLRNLPSVVFFSRDASLDAAIETALAGAERAVRRKLRRRRMRNLRGRAAGPRRFS